MANPMQTICPIIQELTNGTTITYDFSLSNNSQIVDVIHSTTTVIGNVTTFTIPYDFKLFYF